MVLTNLLIKYLIILIHKYDYKDDVKLKNLIREWYPKKV